LSSSNGSASSCTRLLIDVQQMVQLFDSSYNPPSYTSPSYTSPSCCTAMLPPGGGFLSCARSTGGNKRPLVSGNGCTSCKLLCRR
jgi:hypothetical protein